jgi:hypothetical protein
MLCKWLVPSFFILCTLAHSQAFAMDITFLNEFNLSEINNNKSNPDNLLSLPDYGLKNIVLFEQKTTLMKGDLILDGRLFANHNHILNNFSNTSKSTSEYTSEINELFYNYFGDTYLVSFGRKKVKWGVAYTSSPTDVVSPPNTAEDPSDTLSSVHGSDLAQLTLYGDTSQFDFFILPLSKHNNGFIESPALATRVYKYIAPFDLSLVSRLQENGESLYGINNSVAIGNDVELHSEYTWMSYNNLLYPTSKEGLIVLDNRSNPVSRFLFGGQWSPNKDWNFVLEYFHFTDGFSNKEWTNYQSMLNQLNLSLTNELTKETAISSFNSFSSRNQFPLRQNYLFTRILRKKITSKTDLELIVLLGLDDGSYIQQSTVSIQTSNSVKIYIKLLTSAGDGDTEFGQFPNDYQIFTGLKVKI